MTKQRDAFLRGEGDAWFDRNAHVLSDTDDSPVWIDDLAELVEPGQRVLEIGCANGRNLAALTQRTGCVGYGVDPSAAAVADGIERFGLDLRVGTADETGFEDTFDVVIVGFCLYLVDRSILSTSVASIDRHVASGGYLLISDFDPPEPRRRVYHHLEGVFSYKLDYPRLFAAFPHYAVASKRSYSHSSTAFSVDPAERVASTILHKNLEGGYFDEGG